MTNTRSQKLDARLHVSCLLLLTSCILSITCCSSTYINTTNEVYVFLIDDILLSPAKGLFYIFKQIHKAAEEEFLNEENVSAELSELYMMLETGKITEEEFNNRESELLNRLEQIEEYKKKHFAVVEESEADEDRENEDEEK